MTGTGFGQEVEGSLYESADDCDHRAADGERRLLRRRVNAERLGAQVQDLAVYVPESEPLRDTLPDVRAAAPHPPRDGHSRPRFHTNSLRPPASNLTPVTLSN